MKHHTCDDPFMPIMDKHSPHNFYDIYFKLSGNRTKIADYYDIERGTLYKFFERHPEIKRNCDKIYEYFEVEMLDLADRVIKMAMNEYADDKKNAILAAKISNDNVGWHRNRGNKSPPQKMDGFASGLDILNGTTDVVYEEIKEESDI